jgi:hypothetical protein
MLAWQVDRQVKLNFGRELPEISEAEILLLYSSQLGCCAVTGSPLVLDKAFHPETLAITRKDPEKPWTNKNTIIVGLALKPFIDKWGIGHLQSLARRVVKHKDRTTAAKKGK